MKTSLELPDDLAEQVRLRALHEGKDLKDTIADLLRTGLAVRSETSRATFQVDEDTLSRRRAVSEKFISGEWGAELVGFEAERERDRSAAKLREIAWRAP